MFTLFDQEKISEMHDYDIAREERISNLKLLMENLGFSAQQALDALSIPAEDRPEYVRYLSIP